MPKRRFPKIWRNSKFTNPFVLKRFWYNNKEYSCPDSYTQTLLYLYLYGISHHPSVIKLFEIYDGTERITLKERSMYHILMFLKATDGVIEEDDYSHMYNQLYKYCLKYSVEYGIDYPIVHPYKHMIEEWEIIIKVWILNNYPNIIKELQTKYPDINFFL